MTIEYHAQCDCGQVRATIADLSPSSCNHVFCYCKDCQAYAHYLGAADKVLDDRGGTEVCQISCGKLRFTSGQEHLSAMRLSGKGIMRWYASCCRSPIGNTAAQPGVPFVGLIHTFLRNGNAIPVYEAATGPVRASGFIQEARGGKAASRKKHDRISAYLLQLACIMIPAFLRREDRRHPLFNPETREPVGPVETITLSERKALEEKVHAWPASS